MPTEIIVIALTNKVSELTEKLDGLLQVVEKLTLESLKKSKSKGSPSIGNDEIKDMIKKEVTKGYINKLYGKNK
jgi:hypothetical protein